MMKSIMMAVSLIAVACISCAFAGDIPPMPKAGQIESTVSGWTAAINALKAAWEGSAWLIPWITFFVTQGSALFKWPNTVPFLRFVAGNWGHATNAK
jgi:hypothetical protein